MLHIPVKNTDQWSYSRGVSHEARARQTRAEVVCEKASEVHVNGTLRRCQQTLLSQDQYSQCTQCLVELGR